MATTLGAARAPDGFEIVEQCPLPHVADRTELTKLVGQKFLYAFDDKHYGWYIGTIAGTTVRLREMGTVQMGTILTFASVPLRKMGTDLLGSWWP